MPAKPVHDWRWDDVRVLLALARERQVIGAARVLRVDAATISRRLQSVESALGAPLFQRTGRTLQGTERLDALLPLFEAVEASMAEVFAEAERHDAAAGGPVRVTTPPMMSEHLLVPRVAELQRRAPTIELELDSDARVLDLTGREVDIALRTVPAREAGLIARRVAELRLEVAVSPALRKSLGPASDWAEVPWIPGGTQPAFVQARGGRAVLRASKPSIQIAAAAAGLGAVLVPAVLAAEMGLVPLELSRPLREVVDALPPLPVWLVTRQTVRRSARIRTVWDWLTECARELERRR